MVDSSSEATNLRSSDEEEASGELLIISGEFRILVVESRRNWGGPGPVDGLGKEPNEEVETEELVDIGEEKQVTKTTGD